MSKAKKGTGKKPKTRSALEAVRDLFRQHAIPPSPLHHLVQEIAQQEGWVPPLNREEHIKNRKKAGQSSGRSRSGRAEIRRSLVSYARARLSPEDRRTPYSERAFQALRRQVDDFLRKSPEDEDPIIAGILGALSSTDRDLLKETSDDTLKRDLKIIRRRRGVRR